MKFGAEQKSGRPGIRGNSGLGPSEEGLTLSGGTGNLDQIKISAGEIFRIIKDDLVRVANEIVISGNLEQDLKSRWSNLSQQPIIDNHFFVRALMRIYAEEENSFFWVETNKIIGRPFAKDSSDGWSREYNGRKGRIIQIVMNFLRGVLQGRDDMVEAEIEHVFHQNRPGERIQLLVLEGPGGPIYLVEDGTHRVAAAKLLGLEHIPCAVKRIKYPLRQKTTDQEMFDHWRRLINLGLIQGKLQYSHSNGSTTTYEIQVTSELLPWIRVYQYEFLRINEIYETVYPNSLENLSIPRDVLLDEIANNYFMAGRWQEWEQKFSNNPRNENGLVIYGWGW